MKYTEEHEWLKPEKDIVIVGITKHAAEQLGDLVFVELPKTLVFVFFGNNKKSWYGFVIGCPIFP